MFRHHLSLLRLRRRLYHFQPHLLPTDPSPQTIATLINTQPTPWPHHFITSTLSPLLSRLPSSSLLLLLRILSSAAALPLFNLSLHLNLPLDHRHSSLLLHLLLRHPSSPTPALHFLLSLRRHRHLLSDRLFNPLIRSLSLSGRLRAALSLFHLMPSLDVSPSTFTFNSLLLALFRRGRTQYARRLFDEMLHTKIAPDVCTFNTLIRGFSLNGSLDEAFEFFHQMRQHGCCPDVVTYNTLLDGLCRAGKIETAHNFLNGMRRRSREVSPNVVSYTTLIRGYCCGGGDVGKAVELVDEMIEMGLKPNKITYNTLVKGLCEARRMDLVKEVLERDTGFKPDTCTFNTLMAAHCSFGRVDDAVKVFDRMLELQVKTDSASYSTLIRGLCKSGEFERAEALVDEMLEKGVLGRRGVCVPLVAAYNPIFELLCQNAKADKAAMLLRQLVERRATIDIAAFKMVILGYCREGELREGYKLLVSMVRRNLKADLEIFEVLIEGFLAKEDAGFAWKTLKRMLSCGYQPSTSTFHSVLTGLLKKGGLAEEAGNVVAVMVERKVRHNVDLSTDVVAGLLGKGLNDRAFEIVGLIYDNGYFVKMEKLVGCLYEGKKYLEARDLLLFSLKRNENLDAKVYARAISGLCATGKASEAFELFYGMTEKGSEFAVSSCLNDLRNALETNGKLREAEFVSKQMTRVKTEPLILRSVGTGTPTRAQHNMTPQHTTNSRKVHRNNKDPSKVSRPARVSNTRWPYSRSAHAS